MYTSFYKLTGRPFQLSPDPRFFFGSRSHRKAIAYLTYGLSEREGFIVITGDVGAGKTTLVGHLLGRIDREKFIYGHVMTTQLEADDALRMVASAFRLQHRDTDKATLLQAIEAFLIDARQIGKHVLLVVDEVQNMPPKALEELRMLSNFQLDGKPLFQCFLLGQPQFRRMIAGDDMEQLRQRVIASCHLSPLGPDETREYILHRLGLVGWQHDPSFSEEAFERIYAHTGGVPRRVNNLCSRILLYGSLESLHDVDEKVVEEVARELAEEGTQHSVRDRQTRAAAGETVEAAPSPTRAPTPLAVPRSVPGSRTAPAQDATLDGLLGPRHDESLADLKRRVRVLKGGR